MLSPLFFCNLVLKVIDIYLKPCYNWYIPKIRSYVRCQDRENAARFAECPLQIHSLLIQLKRKQSF